METENFSCKKQHVTGHTAMWCQCDTKEPGGRMSVLRFLPVGHETGWCDESLLEICAAINHKSSISSEAYGAPECTACNSTHFNPTPWNERRRTQRTNQFHYNWPKMSFLAANISHRRANLYLYWQHVGLFIKKRKKTQRSIAIDFLFCGQCNFYTILQSELIEF